MAILNPNLEHLEAAALALEPILGELVFVGGTLTGLLVDDPGAGGARPTDDVDVVAEIAGNPGYQWAQSKMKELGFQPDSREGAPMCRWVKGTAVVDLVGTGATPLGATNRWYESGFKLRVPYGLPSGRTIFILPPVVFLLSKWEAFKSRGKGDFDGSRDIEDILHVLSGCRGLRAGFEGIPAEVLAGAAEMAQALMGSEKFLYSCLESLAEGKEVARSILEQLAGAVSKQAPLVEDTAPKISKLLVALKTAHEQDNDAAHRDKERREQIPAMARALHAQIKSLFGEDPAAAGVSFSEEQSYIQGPKQPQYQVPLLRVHLPQGKRLSIQPNRIQEDIFELQAQFQGGPSNQAVGLYLRPPNSQGTWTMQVFEGSRSEQKPWTLEAFEELIHARLFR